MTSSPRRRACERFVRSPAEHRPWVSVGAGAVEMVATVRAASSREPRQVFLLVLDPAAGDHVQLGVLAVGALDEAGERGALEVRQVFAGEEAHQVGRGDDRLSVDQVHATSCPRRGSGRGRRPVR